MTGISPVEFATSVISGDVPILAGVRFTVAPAVFEVSAKAVAVIATVAALSSVGGGVYRPAGEMTPIGGVTVQRTAGFGAPVTVAVNCCGADPANRFAAG